MCPCHGTGLLQFSAIWNELVFELAQLVLPHLVFNLNFECSAPRKYVRESCPEHITNKSIDVQRSLGTIPFPFRAYSALSWGFNYNTVLQFNISYCTPLLTVKAMGSFSDGFLDFQQISWHPANLNYHILLV